MKGWIRAALVAAVALVPASASADWMIGGYFGASWTAPTTLTLTREGSSPITLSDIHFRSRSFESPPYYGYRVSWYPSSTSRAGLEAELTHLKVYAPDALAIVTPNGEFIAIERFSISHGLNLLLGNLVLRHPVSGRWRLTARLGAGVAIPHGESRIAGVDQEQYEISGLALQGAAGPEFRLSKRIRAFAEYKLTTAAPTVSVDRGNIKGRYTSQHLAAGLGVAW
jgi:Outer membrane protein beta-barrel domain